MLLPEAFYKYQCIDSDVLWRRFEQVLEGKVYFAKPSQFNDPWDVKPVFDRDQVDDLLASPDGRLKFLTETPNWTMETIARFVQDPNLQEIFFRELTAKIRSDLEGNWRIYCAAISPVNHLMWAHYGFGHRGICLEFKSTAFPFRLADPVEYTTVYPRVGFEVGPPLFRSLLLKKLLDWCYEDEFRIIARQHDKLAPGERTRLIAPADGQIEYERDALVSIILGCNATQTLTNRIREKIQGTSIKLQRVEKAVDEFKLTLLPV